MPPSEGCSHLVLLKETRENYGLCTLDNATKMLGYKKKNWNLPKIVLQKKLDY